MTGKYLYVCILFVLITTLMINPADSCDVFNAKEIAYQRSAEDENVLDVTLTFDINNSCKADTETFTLASVLVQDDQGQKPVCQILQPQTLCLQSGSCRCDGNRQLYSVTRKVKVDHRETWLLVAEVGGKQQQETVVVVDTSHCSIKTDGPRYTNLGDQHLNATLTFSINCKTDTVQILVTNSNGNQLPVCQFVKKEQQSFSISSTADCTYDDEAHEFSLTRTIKTTDRETWHLLGDVQGASLVKYDFMVGSDRIDHFTLREDRKVTHPFSTTSRDSDLDQKAFSDSPTSETTAANEILPTTVENDKHQSSPQHTTPSPVHTQEIVSVVTLDLEKKQKETDVVEEDKKNEALSSSPTPDLLVFVLIGAIGGFFVIIIALIAVLFAVLFRKRERRRSRRWRDDVPTAPPVPCQFRQRHPVLEPTVVFTQRPLPDPLSPPTPTPPLQPPAFTLQRQQSSDYTPLGETEHFYSRIPGRKSDSSTRSCKTASSLTSVEDSSGGYMIPPEPRSLNGEAEGTAASADVTTTVAEASDYLHPV